MSSTDRLARQMIPYIAVGCCAGDVEEGRRLRDILNAGRAEREFHRASWGRLHRCQGRSQDGPALG